MIIPQGLNASLNKVQNAQDLLTVQRHMTATHPLSTLILVRVKILTTTCIQIYSIHNLLKPNNTMLKYLISLKEVCKPVQGDACDI